MTNPERRQRPTMADVTVAGSGLPSRGLIYGPEGTGKSSLGCMFPRPIFMMTRGETGLGTLTDAKRVSQTPHFPEILCSQDVRGVVRLLTDQPHDYQTLVIDTINGVERLYHEHVCQREFGGRWGRDGFTRFNTGYDVALADWRELLGELDRLREVRCMGIVALCHARIAPFKNPEGADYDRFTPDLHAKTWGLTHKWADYVLFINFDTYVDGDRSQRANGKGGTRRVLHTERSAAFDAKNRHGLPERIDCGDSAAEAWANLSAAMKAGKASTQVQGQPADVPQDQLQVSQA
jgi:hypothetical protein